MNNKSNSETKKKKFLIMIILEWKENNQENGKLTACMY